MPVDTVEPLTGQLDAEAALAAASGEDLRDEVVPGIRDPFKNTPVE